MAGSSGHNSAAPGLFPSLPIEELSDAVTVDSGTFTRVVNVLPDDYKDQMADDKFYLTRLYRRMQGDMHEQGLLYQTFNEYDRALNKELKMRDKLKDTEKLSSESGIRLGTAEDIYTTFTRGITSPAKVHSSSSKRFKSLFHRQRTEMSLYREKNLILDAKSNQTAVIDEEILENDYIDCRFEKNKHLVCEEIEASTSRSSSDLIFQANRMHAERPTIQRKLKVRHLQMISLGATIGVGVVLNSGKAFSIAGPLGALIGYAIGGSIILATLLSFAEVVALIPLISGISGFCSRFVGEAFGFSVGWCHWLSYAVAFPSELIASTIILSYYPVFAPLSTDKAWTATTITVMVVVLTSLNLSDVRFYGEFEYLASALKLLVVLTLILLMIIQNVGALGGPFIGFKFWNSSKSPSADITFGPFRPTFDLLDTGYGSKNGVPGFGGGICSCIASSLVAVFSYVGSEIGFVAASEAQNPRKAVPTVTKRIFTRVIVFYILSIFVVGLNFYSGDPRLLRYYSPNNVSAASQTNYSNFDGVINLLGGLNCYTASNPNFLLHESSSQSPWVIALQSIKRCRLSSAVNGLFVGIGISAASSQLYASSRTLYSMATQRKAPSFFLRCTKAGVPYACVIFCGLFGFLSLLCLNLNSTETFVVFVNIGTMGSVIMWSAMNFAFLRFYLALKRRPDIISRHLREYPYKSPLQPYLACYGLVMTLLLLLLNGFQNFFYWQTQNFISSYLTIVVFLVLFVGYGWRKGYAIYRLDQIDLDLGRRELDRVIWKEKINYSLSMKELFNRFISYL
ncbi:LAMI_0H07382g1_1 [Lachancea mirantina]|uniref:LAMI_0H07382g1_1 n=1 Tax=Lachancea mirantina TaxID=1230905 RepID=A0A1G4KFS9_9SACH|nr:LAMI_0H07382g1_1 [Lachancea mirantina]